MQTCLKYKVDPLQALLGAQVMQYVWLLSRN